MLAASKHLFWVTPLALGCFGLVTEEFVFTHESKFFVQFPFFLSLPNYEKLPWALIATLSAISGFISLRHHFHRTPVTPPPVSLSTSSSTPGAASIPLIHCKFEDEKIQSQLQSGQIPTLGQSLSASVLFTQIHNFPEITGGQNPERTFALLNEYLQIAARVIRAHGGVIEKNIGDTLLAVWGIPHPSPENDSYNAVTTCLTLRQELVALNEIRQKRGEPPILIGMSIFTGDVIAGVIDLGQGGDYSVIGDAVNNAARIEALTETFQSDLLISKSTYDRVKSFFLLESCSRANLQIEPIYKVLGYVTENNQAVKMETQYSVLTEEKIERTKRIELPPRPATQLVSPPPFPSPQQKIKKSA